MDINKILNEIKISLSKNGVAISNLVTYALLFKNLPSHYKLVKNSLNEKKDSPYEKLKKLLKEHPELMDKPAIIQDREITYGELEKETENLANYLDNIIKCQKGDNISICAESSIEGIISFFSMNALGVVNARIFNDSKNDKMKENILNFNSETIFIDEKNIDVLSEIVSETKIKNVILISKCDEEILNKFSKKNPNIIVKTYADIQIEGEKLPQHKHVDVYENDIASILYTSGSSGEPKPIEFPNRSYTNMVDIVRITTNEKVANDERVAGVVSHEYPYAANNGTTMILLLGKTLVLPEHKDSSIAKLLKNKINKIQAIPSFYKMLSKEITSDKLSIDDKLELINNLSYLDYAVTGGEPYQKSEKKDLLSIFVSLGYSPLLIDGFGFSELGSAAALKFGLCDYFLLMNGIEAMAINPETRKILKKGEEGILCFSGPTITKGYYNNDEATKKSFVLDEKNKMWFISDTYGSVNGVANRLIKLAGRIRECFITNDGNGNFVKVYSGNVENVLLSSGVIKDCIVVQSDPGPTPTPVAYVSLKQDCNLTEEEIIKILKEKCLSLETFSQPTKITIENEIMRTTADKKNYNYYKEIQYETQHTR